MSENFKIDLEQETIEINGVKQGREALSAEITKMIAAGNFKIGSLAGALEHLDQALSTAKSLSFKVSAEVFAKLAELAKSSGQEPAILARNLLVELLDGKAGASSASAASNPSSAAEAGKGESAEAQSTSSEKSADSSNESAGSAGGTSSDNKGSDAALGSVQNLVDSLVLTPKKRKAELVSDDEAVKADPASETVLDLGVVARQK